MTKLTSSIPVIILRWMFFLPIAIIASALFSGGFNYIFHMILPDWKIMKLVSISAWFVTGVLTPMIWMAVGYAIAPKKINVVKWILLLPLLFFMGGGLIAIIYMGEREAYNVPSSSINPFIGNIILLGVAFVYSLVFVFASPEEKEKIDKKTESKPEEEVSFMSFEDPDLYYDSKTKTVKRLSDAKNNDEEPLF